MVYKMSEILGDIWDFIESNWGTIFKIIVGAVAAFGISSIILKGTSATNTAISNTSTNLTNVMSVIEDLAPAMVMMMFMSFMFSMFNMFPRNRQTTQANIKP